MKPGRIILFLIVCLLMGITIISMGLGAAIPSINKIAKPFLCPNGDMFLEKQRFNPYAGKVVTSNIWYCGDENAISTPAESKNAMTVDELKKMQETMKSGMPAGIQNDGRTRLGNGMIFLCAGSIYGLILFVLLFIVMLAKGKRAES